MKKPMASFVPACIDPPMPPWKSDDPEALAEWLEFRTELDALERSLSVDRPELDWSEAMRPHKAEADQAIKALRTGSPVE